MFPDSHKRQTSHVLLQVDNRIKQWWGDELTSQELDWIASGAQTVSEVLKARAFGAAPSTKPM